MEIIDIIKYITGLVTTFLAIYGLINNFTKELKDKKGIIVRKVLTKQGKVNIIILIVLAFITLTISIIENINKKDASKKIKELEDYRYMDTKSALELNLKHVQNLILDLYNFKKQDSINSDKTLSNQLTFAKSIERSNQNLKSIDNFSKTINTKILAFQENINQADSSITRFHRDFINSKDIFDKIYIKGHFNVNYYTSGLARLLEDRLLDPNTEFTYLGKKFFANYLSSFYFNNSLVDSRLFENITISQDSINFKECLRTVCLWIARKGSSSFTKNEISHEINRLIQSKKSDYIYTGLYLKALINTIENEITSSEKWNVIVDLNDKNFENINKYQSLIDPEKLVLDYSDFILEANRGLQTLSLDYKEYSLGFKISDLRFTVNGIDFNFELDLGKKLFENKVFKISELNTIALHFLCSFISYGDKVEGNLELNNSIKTKMAFSGAFAIIEIK